MTKRNKLTKKQLVTIEELYMQYKSISAIAREFNVARSTIVWHINSNGWEAKRKLNESELLTAFTDAKKVDFVNMTQHAATIMTRSLQNLATRAEPPSINEATRAADILKTLDNILRLDDNKPTEIIENKDKPLDDAELKRKLSADPFINVEEEEEENDKKLN